MAENRRSDGVLTTFENCTAISNIPAGTPVAIRNQTSGYAADICTLGHDVAALTASDLCGYSFIGVLDEDVSAGECPVTVWTEGVFRFQFASSVATAQCHPGAPVFAESGQTVNIHAGGPTGDVAIGSMVNLMWSAGAVVPGMGAAVTGTRHTGKPYVDVRIKPGVFRWGTVIAAATASASPWGVWPKRA